MAAPKPKQVRTMTTRFSRPSLIALAVSLSALSGGVTQAAEEMDHSAMGHGSMSMDHSQMGHGSAKAPMEGMDHSKMDMNDPVMQAMMKQCMNYMRHPLDIEL